MRMRTITTVFFLSFSFSIFAQHDLSREQVLEDYLIFKNILTTGHPSLYEYTSPKEWDSLFTYFETEEIENITDSDALFRSLCALVTQAKDGHLTLLHPKMDVIPKMFPLVLKIIDDKLYTDTDDFGIPVGSKIIAIDKLSSQEVLTSLLKYTVSDGYNLTKKYRQIEEEFGLLHYYEFGTKENYSVKYTSPDGVTQTIEITSQTFDDIGKKYISRNSYFSNYHQNSNRIEHFINTIGQELPFVDYIDSLDTALLTINSFGLEPEIFKSNLIELFNEIKKKKSSTLIIDIRQNKGGYAVNQINLLSFLIHESYQPIVSGSVVTVILPEKEHAIHSLSDYDEFFASNFDADQKENDRWFVKEERIQTATIHPNKKPFKGKVYLLVGGKTFSAASDLALAAKNLEGMTLIGEETGGGYYFHTGNYSVVYQFSNSKIMMRMSFMKMDKYVLNNSIPKGSGVLPDIEVSLIVQDLIDGKDSQLDYVLQQIHEDK